MIRALKVGDTVSLIEGYKLGNMKITRLGAFMAGESETGVRYRLKPSLIARIVEVKSDETVA